MFDRLIDQLKKDKTKWAGVQDMFIKREVPSKTILLHEGEISTHFNSFLKGRESPQ